MVSGTIEEKTAKEEYRAQRNLEEFKRKYPGEFSAAKAELHKQLIQQGYKGIVETEYGFDIPTTGESGLVEPFNRETKGVKFTRTVTPEIQTFTEGEPYGREKVEFEKQREEIGRNAKLEAQMEKELAASSDPLEKQMIRRFYETKLSPTSLENMFTRPFYTSALEFSATLGIAGSNILAFTGEKILKKDAIGFVKGTGTAIGLTALALPDYLESAGRGWREAITYIPTSPYATGLTKALTGKGVTDVELRAMERTAKGLAGISGELVASYLTFKVVEKAASVAKSAAKIPKKLSKIAGKELSKELKQIITKREHKSLVIKQPQPGQSIYEVGIKAETFDIATSKGTNLLKAIDFKLDKILKPQLPPSFIPDYQPNAFLRAITRTEQLERVVGKPPTISTPFGPTIAEEFSVAGRLARLEALKGGIDVRNLFKVGLAFRGVLTSKAQEATKIKTFKITIPKEFGKVTPKVTPFEKIDVKVRGDTRIKPKVKPIPIQKTEITPIQKIEEIIIEKPPKRKIPKSKKIKTYFRIPSLPKFKPVSPKVKKKKVKKKRIPGYAPSIKGIVLKKIKIPDVVTGLEVRGLPRRKKRR
jgi:hypothetical protein